MERLMSAEPTESILSGDLLVACAILYSKSCCVHNSWPIIEIIAIPVSTEQEPISFKLLIIASKLVVSSIVIETETSEVVTKSTGVLYCSNISKILLL